MNIVQFKGRRIAQPDYSLGAYREGELLSELAHKIGHEIGNPLTAIISLGSLLQRVSKDSGGLSNFEKTSSYIDSMVNESWRVGLLNERMVLLLSSRPNNQELSPVRRVVEKAVQRLQSNSDFADLDPEITLHDEESTIQIDPGQFQVAISELLRNAHIESKEVDKPSKIKVSASQNDQGETVVEVSNRFSSPLPEDLSQVFRPFIKGQETKKGSGLGLAVVWSIVEKAGGKLEVEEDRKSGEDTFTTRITVPPSKLVEIELGGSRSSKSSSKPEQSLTPASLPESIRVLVIEDEMMVATAIEKILSVTVGKNAELNTQIMSGTEAVEKIRAGALFHAVLCDINMKGINGKEIHQILKQERPEILDSFAFITGDKSSPDLQSFMKNSGCPWLHKPFETEDLVDLVEKLISN